MMGSSSSVVSTVSRLPRVKMVERFLKEALEEKKLTGGQGERENNQEGECSSLIPRNPGVSWEWEWD